MTSEGENILRKFHAVKSPQISFYPVKLMQNPNASIWILKTLEECHFLIVIIGFTLFFHRGADHSRI